MDTRQKENMRLSFSYSLYNALHTGLESPHSPGKPYDPDLIYVECRFCGKPIVWEKGRTRALISASGMDSSLFDEYCLLLSEGCAACAPELHHFALHLVRVACDPPRDLLLLSEHMGHS